MFILSILGNEMEYEHLFAESDIEESDVTAIGPYTNSAHSTTSENNFVYDDYLARSNTTSNQIQQDYWQAPAVLNCNMCQNRQERNTKKSLSPHTTRSLLLNVNSCESRACDNYRRKRVLHERDLTIKYKTRKNEEQKLLNGQQPDSSLSIAGPSRLPDNSISDKYL